MRAICRKRLKAFSQESHHTGFSFAFFFLAVAFHFRCLQIALVSNYGFFWGGGGGRGKRRDLKINLRT